MGAHGDLYCGRCGRQVVPPAPCPARCPVPGENGTICLAAGGLPPAGPCPADCPDRYGEERRGRSP